MIMAIIRNQLHKHQMQQILILDCIIFAVLAATTSVNIIFERENMNKGALTPNPTPIIFIGQLSPTTAPNGTNVYIDGTAVPRPTTAAIEPIEQ